MTEGMKVAISIPDEVFAKADVIAQRLNTSRSAFYTEAVRKHVLEHDTDAVIDQWNAVIDSLSEEEKEEDLRFLNRANYLMAQRTEW